MAVSGLSGVGRRAGAQVAPRLLRRRGGRLGEAAQLRGSCSLRPSSVRPRLEVEAAPNPAPRSLWRHGVRAGEAKVAGRGADVSRPDRSLLRCRRGTRDSHPHGSFGCLGWCSEERRRCGACAVLFDRFSVRRGATGRHASEADAVIASAVWCRWSWVALRTGGSRFVVGLRLAEVLASGRFLA
jgi:hypothetical protein